MWMVRLFYVELSLWIVGANCIHPFPARRQADAIRPYVYDIDFHPATITKNSSSFKIVTPSSRALSNLLPGLAPTTT